MREEEAASKEGLLLLLLPLLHRNSAKPARIIILALWILCFTVWRRDLALPRSGAEIWHYRDLAPRSGAEIWHRDLAPRM